MNSTNQQLDAMVKRAQAAVIEARGAIREAVQTSNIANACWWEKELKLRQNVWTKWANELEHAAKVTGGAQ